MNSWFEQHGELPVLLSTRLDLDCSILLSVLQNHVAPSIILSVEQLISWQLLAQILQSNVLGSNLDRICADEVVVVDATVFRLSGLHSDIVFAGFQFCHVGNTGV